MLSYRHAFHAGNHADVLKHWTLFALLQYMNRKDKPWWYIETHGGAGCYALADGRANETGEYLDGIARLWERTDLPESLVGYRDVVAQFNPGRALNLYPGSPAIAMSCAREQDRLKLFELHPADLNLLRETFSEEQGRVQVRGEDGFAGLRSLLPPAPRRALVLIDPPYEQKAEYGRVIEALNDALKRFPSGTYAVWYPLLKRLDVVTLRERLRKLPAAAWLDVTLAVTRPPADGFGLYGSGMFIINPPYTLPGVLQEGLPLLQRVLGRDAGASHSLEWQIP